uniref:WAPL domain-containing protein n=1 Tax=Ascaris lumbricoides TaxID=6252 RepID=A0A0M3I182_ASCLU
LQCATPCREAFIDIDNCQKKICKDVREQAGCEQSCEYLQRIYAEKPGVCPQPAKIAPSDECSALCRLDGDCPEASKCCTVGCSRRCLGPRTQDPRLLPIPTRVSVQERKRKRSAVVRWVMQQMRRHHTTSNANLYVLQWRWSVRKDESTMTDWQTIMVKNKMYAIMKHLLSPGRYYMFRVAAVNVHGSLGFSASSPPFKLSKEARAPGQPRGLSLGPSSEDARGLWKQKVSWTPPLSDLPIKSYILSWQKSSVEQANAYEDLMRRKSELERQGKRSTTHDDDEVDSDESFAAREQLSTIVPSYETSAYVEGLLPASVYLVEVHACVDSSDGELHGEKAIVFIRTAQSSMNSSEEVSFSRVDVVTMPTSSEMPMHLDSSNVALLEIKTPYYEGGDLKTAVSWLNAKHCSPIRTTFLVRWRLLECQLNENQKRTFYDLDTSGQDWAEMRVTECVAILEELNFGCSYSVEVNRMNENELTATGHFKTESCELTPSAEPIPCGQIQDAHALWCSTDGIHMQATCTWQAPRLRTTSTSRTHSLVGFRIALTAPEEELNNVTIIPPHRRDIHFTHLHANTQYTVYVQAITNTGLGDTMMTAFNIPSEQTIGFDSTFPSNSAEPSSGNAENDRKFEQINEGMDQSFRRFPGSEIIELPLESGVAMDVRWHKAILLCFCVQYILRSLIWVQ